MSDSAALARIIDALGPASTVGIVHRVKPSEVLAAGVGRFPALRSDPETAELLLSSMAENGDTWQALVMYAGADANTFEAPPADAKPYSLDVGAVDVALSNGQPVERFDVPGDPLVDAGVLVRVGSRVMFSAIAVDGFADVLGISEDRGLDLAGFADALATRAQALREQAETAGFASVAAIEQEAGTLDALRDVVGRVAASLGYECRPPLGDATLEAVTRSLSRAVYDAALVLEQASARGLVSTPGHYLRRAVAMFAAALLRKSWADAADRGVALRISAGSSLGVQEIDIGAAFAHGFVGETDAHRCTAALHDNGLVLEVDGEAMVLPWVGARWAKAGDADAIVARPAILVTLGGAYADILGDADAVERVVLT